MKVLMINPPFLPMYSRQSRSPCVTKGGTFYYPYYLAYATGNLEKHGFQTKLVDAVASEWSREQTLDFIKKFKPDIVFVDTSTPSIYNDIQIASKIKDLGVRHVSLVGTHPTRLPNKTLNLSEKIDSICSGEYDITVVELAEAIEKGKTLKGIKGLTYRGKKKIIHNPDRP
ncbi:MAG: cobalamin-dependent protein, partial [Candidatus Aenigmarchaeota archaeon]